ncbi:MAG: LacI family DNA-binding transcriptional regulator [Actinomycetota bacterium]|nr:LacI family DNA-binding transcriptional regulator [Actinomycetota bacterium]
MAEVAAAAGVSIPTVSKVLNGRADVAPQTRERVGRLLTELGYVAQPRFRRRAGVIDLVLSEFSEWATEVVRGAEEAALASGSRIAVTALRGDVAERLWWRSLVASRTDGVLLVLADLAPLRRDQLAALRVPVVAIEPASGPDPGAFSVSAANWAGGLRATEYLLGLGHCRIGTITGRRGLECSRRRLDGYTTALRRAGIPVDPALVALGNFHYESALDAAAAMLSLVDPPTAIFAASDVQAMGVYEAARRRGLRIPEHLSVIGFDDVPMAALACPPLTTLHQPLAEMAALAVGRLVGRGEPPLSGHVELDTNLVVRASTAPPPARIAAAEQCRTTGA